MSSNDRVALIDAAINLTKALKGFTAAVSQVVTDATNNEMHAETPRWIKGNVTWALFSFAQAATDLAHVASNLHATFEAIIGNVDNIPVSELSNAQLAHIVKRAHAATTLGLAQAAAFLVQAAHQIPFSTDNANSFYDMTTSDVKSFHEMIEFGKYNNKECENRKAIRELIMHENTIHDQRRNFLW